MGSQQSGRQPCLTLYRYAWFKTDRLIDLKIEMHIQVSKMELKMISRTACPEIDDYLDTVLQSALRSYKLDTGNFKWVTTANLSVALFLIGVCALYLVDSNLLSQSARNALGLVTLSIPFASVGTGLLAPKAYAAIDDQLCKLLNRDAFYQQEAEQRKRVIYHEAGHCLAGYLCGIPVVDYDISGEQDAGLSVLVELTTTKTQASDAMISNTALDRSMAGGLLIVAVAGVVAETLYCGDSKGGRQDFPIAYEILRQFYSSDLSPDKYSTQTMEDAQDGYLRWALSKAFILLQLHEVALKAVAREMEKRSSMADCLAAIEIACLPSDRMDSS